jgi:hypothetical protein
VPGGLTLFVGRPAEEGERPVGGPLNLLAEGPLHCLQLDTLPFADAERALEQRGYEVVWYEEYTTSVNERGLPATGDGGRLEGLPSEEHALIGAMFLEPGVVELRVTPRDDPNYGVMRWWGWSDELRSEDPRVRYQGCFEN